MSPEQALARHGLVDHRTDVYGLGATLYELLTLTPAVDGADKQEMLRQIAFEDPTPPRKLDKAIPAELETIALKCLAKNPSERYATAGELADDLRRFLADRTIKAKPPSLPQKAVKWARRHQPLVRAAAVIALILAGSLGWIIRDWQARRTEAEGRVTEALAEAEPKLREGDPHDPALISAARKAEAQLAGGLLRKEARHRVEQLLADLTMLEKLELASLMRAEIKDEHFDESATDPAYAQAFREYGIDVEMLGVPEAAAPIRTRAIRLHLAAALDDWAYARKAAKKTDWQRLLAIAREVDPDPWRCALRDAWASGRPGDLEKVLVSAPVPELSPTTLALVGTLFKEARGSVAQVAVTVLRAGQQRYPADLGINKSLAEILAFNMEPPQSEEAIRFFQAALALRPQSPGVHGDLGLALAGRGKLAEAEAAFRKATELKPDLAAAYSNLGSALKQQGKLAEAEAAYRKAIALKPDDTQAYTNLGRALYDQGKVAEAEAAFRKAIELNPDCADAHNNLGAILCDDLGKPAEAEAAFRKAIELKPGYAMAHSNLGIALTHQGKVAEAEAAFRKAIELDPQLVQLDAKLAQILAGNAQPADAAERLKLAELCALYKLLPVAAVRFYEEAFAAQPALTDDLRSGNRYNAACAAALAGCGQGQDASALGDEERTRLRRQALGWLRADLTAWGQQLDQDPNQARPLVVGKMRHWQGDPDFAGVRGPEALARLPAAERPEWQALWQDVAALLQRADAVKAPADPRLGR
jgi:serine/threonine-protein kinase